MLPASWQCSSSSRVCRRTVHACCSLGRSNMTPVMPAPCVQHRQQGATYDSHRQQHTTSSSGGHSIHHSSHTSSSRAASITASGALHSQHLQLRLLSMITAAAITLSSVAPAALISLLLVPQEAKAKPRMTRDEQVTIEIFKKSTPSVVNVTNLAARRDAFTMNMLEIPQGAGSGFVWDDKGHVITNYHVIADANDIQVTFTGGLEYSARVIGVDQDKDVAVLEVGVDADKVPPAPGFLKPLSRCSNSADLIVGQKVYAIGNPFGLDHTLTTGVVSGTGREIASISGRPIQDVIQSDAAINPGNSGGPLLDSGGCVIGINTAIYSPSGANSGVGFAIPVDVVGNSVGQIIQHGKVVRPVLGISFAPDQSSEQLGVKGILVLSAREGGPAWKAGIRGTSRDEYGRLVLGDIITGMNGTKIRNASDLYKILDKCMVADSLDIEILRGNAKEHVTAVLQSNS